MATEKSGRAERRYKSPSMRLKTGADEEREKLIKRLGITDEAINEAIREHLSGKDSGKRKAFGDEGISGGNAMDETPPKGKRASSGGM